MNTLSWKRTDWQAKNFIFTLGEQWIGKLSFYSSWNFNALYTDEEHTLKFAKKGFWSTKVLITKDAEYVGEIRFGIFGEQILRLATGESFYLATSFWEQEAYWKNEAGETLLTYRQAKMSSMGKGSIRSTNSLSKETENLLISSGLFIRQYVLKQRVLFIAIMIPILTAANRW